MDTQTEPILAPPGAGLPAAELFIARMLFGWRLRGATRESSNAHFQRERDAIRALISSCDAASGARRVLIPRVRGLEDSSRYWSVWMTLDHLRITNNAIAGTMRSLAGGKVPPGKASTAAVKPSPDADASILGKYDASCDAVLAAAAEITNLDTPLRYAHPWFGPLNAAGWHALAGTHMGIHRVQIERIREG